jgi:2-dehydropantoate 2-reductase
VLRLGCYPEGTDGTVERISADLEGSGFDAPVAVDVMSWKYGKLLGNLANALEAVGGSVEGETRTAVWQRLLQEGEAALAAAGIAHPSVAELRAAADARMRILPVEGEQRAGGSSWQSLARGTGDIESDHLNGEIVLLGRLHGVPTPVNEALQRLAAEFARTGRTAGSLPEAELAALLRL